MLITLFRFTTIYQSVAEVQLTDAVPLGAVSCRFIILYLILKYWWLNELMRMYKNILDCLQVVILVWSCRSHQECLDAWEAGLWNTDAAYNKVNDCSILNALRHFWLRNIKIINCLLKYGLYWISQKNTPALSL
jgi:hypothetical protein